MDGSSVYDYLMFYCKFNVAAVALSDQSVSPNLCEDLTINYYAANFYRVGVRDDLGTRESRYPGT